MALRLRRGTNAERQLITPLQGELIYTTDTKLLYVGDGTTVGGTLVTGAGGGSTTLDGLTDTDLSGATNGNVLAFNSGTNMWEPANGGSTTLDGLTDTDLTGAEFGDVLAYNPGTNKWEPSVVPGLSDLSLNDLDGVFINPSDLKPGNVLAINGVGNWTSQPLFQEQQNYKINIVGDDSTIIIDTDTNSITGSFFGDLTGTVIGDVTGNFKGSVFGDDSTLIIDAVDNTIVANIVTSTITDTPTIYGSPAARNDGLNIFIPTGSTLDIVSHNGEPGDPTPTFAGDFIAGIALMGTTGAINPKIASALFSQWDDTADLNTVHPRGNLFFAVGQNSEDPAIVAGIDYTGNFTSKTISPGTYADATARDAAILNPVAGMMVFLTDGDGAGNPKFQGYDGSAWVNLN